MALNLLLSLEDTELFELARNLGWDFKRVQELEHMLRLTKLEEFAVFDKRRNGLRKTKCLTYRGYLPSSKRSVRVNRDIKGGWLT